MDAFPRVYQGLLCRALADLDALIADIDPRIVHHCEHGHQPTVFLADQLADTLILVPIAHDAGGGGVDAELMLDTDAAQIVARSERSILLHVIFGHDEERDPAASFGRIGQAREHEVNDVLRQIVFAPGDVDLLALDPVFARVLAIGDGLGRSA